MFTLKLCKLKYIYIIHYIFATQIREIRIPTGQQKKEQQQKNPGQTKVHQKATGNGNY